MNQTNKLIKERNIFDYTSALLKASRGLNSVLTDCDSFRLSDIDCGIRKSLFKLTGKELQPVQERLSDYLKRFASRPVIYCFTDQFYVDYMLFPLHDLEDRLFVVGPCLLHDPGDNQFIAKMMSDNHLPGNYLKAVTEYYYSIPALESDVWLSIINTLGAQILDSDKYDVVSLDKTLFTSEVFFEPEPDNNRELEMNLMEERYSCENRLMDAIASGDRRTAMAYSQEFFTHRMRPRNTDSLRDEKNNLIIMNTLARKAAERGRVHPVYLNSISRDIALRIEKIGNSSQASEMKLDIIRLYTSAVSQASLGKYPPMIGKAINYIDHNLEMPLSLKDIADELHVNPSYLSTQFKKETGMTLTDYTRDRKIKRAAGLLTSTKMQIQNIAASVGFYDVQYFAKQFKKVTGMTPTAFRQNYNTADSLEASLKLRDDDRSSRGPARSSQRK